DTLLGEPFDVEAVAEQVAAFRGLPLRAAVPIRVIDDGATRHHVVAYDEVAAPTGPDAFWSAIDVVVPDRAASPAPTALFAKGVSALFDEKRTTLWARRPGETNDGERARAPGAERDPAGARPRRRPGARPARGPRRRRGPDHGRVHREPPTVGG